MSAWRIVLLFALMVAARRPAVADEAARLDELITQLSSPDEATRIAALGEFGRRRPVDPVVPALLGARLYVDRADLRATSDAIAALGPEAICVQRELWMKGAAASPGIVAWADAVLPADCFTRSVYGRSFYPDYRREDDPNKRWIEAACLLMPELYDVARPTSTERLIAAFDRDSPVVRRAAAQAFCQIGRTDPTAIPALAARLADDDDPQVRRLAALALGCSGPSTGPYPTGWTIHQENMFDRGPHPKACEPLRSALDDADAAVAFAAAAALARSADTRAAALPVLKRHLQSPPEPRSVTALLGTLQRWETAPDDETVQIVARVLDESDDYVVRSMCLGLLNRYGPSSRAAFATIRQTMAEAPRYSETTPYSRDWQVNEHVWELKPEVAAAMAQADATFVPLLLDELAAAQSRTKPLWVTERNPRGVDFKRSLDVLDLLGATASDDRSAAALLAMHNDPSEPLRRKAIESLAKAPRAPPGFFPLLKARLDDERDSPEVTRAAARALLHFRDEHSDCLPTVLTLFGRRHGRYPRMAADELAAIGPGAKPALPQLLAALQSSDETLREATYRALGALGMEGRDAVGPLIRQCDHWNTGYFRGPQAALIKIGPAAVPMLLQELERAARQRTSADYWPPLGSLLTAVRDAWQPICPLEIPLPVPHQPLQRIGSLEYVLDQLHDDLAPHVATIDLLLRHADPQIRRATLPAVKRIGPGGASLVTRLGEFTAPARYERQIVIPMLVAMGPAADEALTAWLDKGDEAQQTCALEVWRRRGPSAQSMLPRIQRTFADALGIVKEHAAVTIATLAPGDETVWPMLKALVGADNPLRGAAIESLACYEGDARRDVVIPLLVRVLENDRDRDQAAACELARRLGPEARAALPALAQVMRRPSDFVSTKAADAILSILRPRDDAGRSSP